MKLKLTILSFILLIFFQSHAFADTNIPFKTVGGKTTSLQKLMEPGKWTVVMLWSNYCHVCNEEASQYSAFYKAHAKKDAKVIGISLDDSQKIAKSFVDRHKLNYPNLFGSDSDVAQLYQSESGAAFIVTPSFMLYDPQGKLQAVQAGTVPPKVIEDFMKKQKS